MDKPVLEENSSFRLFYLSFTSNLECGSYIVSAASKNISALVHSMEFLSPALVLYLYKSTIRPFMKY